MFTLFTSCQFAAPSCGSSLAILDIFCSKAHTAPSWLYDAGIVADPLASDHLPLKFAVDTAVVALASALASLAAAASASALASSALVLTKATDSLISVIVGGMYVKKSSTLSLNVDGA